MGHPSDATRKPRRDEALGSHTIRGDLRIERDVADVQDGGVDDREKRLVHVVAGDDGDCVAGDMINSKQRGGVPTDAASLFGSGCYGRKRRI